MWIVFWLIFAVVVGAIAAGKGRSGFGWFLLAVLISPLIAIIVLIAVGEGDRGRRQCAACMEWVQAEAKICKHCGRDFRTPKPGAPLPAPRAETAVDKAYAAQQARDREMAAARIRAAAARPSGLAAAQPRQVFRDPSPEPAPMPQPRRGGFVALTRDGKRVELPDGWPGRKEPKL